MLKIGSHLSISAGYYKAALNALDIGANTFQFFTRNPRGGKARDLDYEDIEKLNEIRRKHNFAPLFAHGAYTMNLASKSKKTRDFAKMILKDDIFRLGEIKGTYYIFHPGSHVGQGRDKGIDLIVEGLNEVIEEDNNLNILLEGMSGKGTEIGQTMEELGDIIDRVKYNEKLGICIDTCHLYAAGYDIVNDLDRVLDEIDSIVGLDRVKAVHLNDSKEELGSNKDRHEVLGKGLIGMEAIINIINHPKLRDLTFNLETPNELAGYKKEIEILRRNYK